MSNFEKKLGIYFWEGIFLVAHLHKYVQLCLTGLKLFFFRPVTNRSPATSNSTEITHSIINQRIGFVLKGNTALKAC